MKNKLEKLIKTGVINQTEFDSFITTLVKLSESKVIPNKPKKVLKKLGLRKRDLKLEKKTTPPVILINETEQVS